MNVDKQFSVFLLVTVLLLLFASEKVSKNVTEIQTNKTSMAAAPTTTGGNFLTNAFDAMRKFIFCK